MPPAEDTGMTVDQEVDAARVNAGREMAEDENRERADAEEPEDRGEFNLSSTQGNPPHAKHG